MGLEGPGSGEKGLGAAWQFVGLPTKCVWDGERGCFPYYLPSPYLTFDSPRKGE